MEDKFTSSEILNYIKSEIERGISDTMELSLYAEGISKEQEINEQSLELFLSYIRSLLKCGTEIKDILQTYKVHVHYFGVYFMFWKMYLQHVLVNPDTCNCCFDQVVKDDFGDINVGFMNKFCYCRKQSVLNVVKKNYQYVCERRSVEKDRILIFFDSVIRYVEENGNVKNDIESQKDGTGNFFIKNSNRNTGLCSNKNFNDNQNNDLDQINETFENLSFNSNYFNCDLNNQNVPKSINLKANDTSNQNLYNIIDKEHKTCDDLDSINNNHCLGKSNISKNNNDDKSFNFDYNDRTKLNEHNEEEIISYNYDLHEKFEIKKENKNYKHDCIDKTTINENLKNNKDYGYSNVDNPSMDINNIEDKNYDYDCTDRKKTNENTRNIDYSKNNDINNALKYLNYKGNDYKAIKVTNFKNKLNNIEDNINVNRVNDKLDNDHNSYNTAKNSIISKKPIDHNIKNSHNAEKNALMNDDNSFKYIEMDNLKNKERENLKIYDKVQILYEDNNFKYENSENTNDYYSNNLLKKEKNKIVNNLSIKNNNQKSNKEEKEKNNKFYSRRTEYEPTKNMNLTFENKNYTVKNEHKTSEIISTTNLNKIQSEGYKTPHSLKMNTTRTNNTKNEIPCKWQRFYSFDNVDKTKSQVTASLKFNTRCNLDIKKTQIFRSSNVDEENDFNSEILKRGHGENFNEKKDKNFSPYNTLKRIAPGENYSSGVKENSMFEKEYNGKIDDSDKPNKNKMYDLNLISNDEIDNRINFNDKPNKSKRFDFNLISNDKTDDRINFDDDKPNKNKKYDLNLINNDEIDNRINFNDKPNKSKRFDFNLINNDETDDRINFNDDKPNKNKFYDLNLINKNEIDNKINSDELKFGTENELHELHVISENELHNKIGRNIIHENNYDNELDNRLVRYKIPDLNFGNENEFENRLARNENFRSNCQKNNNLIFEGIHNSSIKNFSRENYVKEDSMKEIKNYNKDIVDNDKSYENDEIKLDEDTVKNNFLLEKRKNTNKIHSYNCSENSNITDDKKSKNEISNEVKLEFNADIDNYNIQESDKNNKSKIEIVPTNFNDKLQPNKKTNEPKKGYKISFKQDPDDYKKDITNNIKKITQSSNTNKNENIISEEGIISRSESKKNNEVFINGKKLIVLNLIGKGGSGRVYSVILNNEMYALKKIRIEGENETVINSYRNEIKFLEKFRGMDEIVQMIEYEEKEDEIFILMEFGECDLTKIVKQYKNQNKNRKENTKNICMPLYVVRYFWIQMLNIVKKIHELRIVHRDLKPANFLLVKGRLKLIDFGISKTIRDNTTNIHTNSQVGTINYMAPEAIDSNNKLGRGADIWSLGCILYEMVYGKVPLYRFSTLAQKLNALIQDKRFQIEFPIIELDQKHREDLNHNLSKELIINNTNYRKDSNVFLIVIKTMKSALMKDPSERATLEMLLNDKFAAFDEEIVLTRNDIIKLLKKTLLLREKGDADILSEQITDAFIKTFYK